MARVAERRGLSAAEYLAWEREQPARHEYFHGEVFAMAGGSVRHNGLCVRVSAALLAQVGKRGCHVLSSDQRVGLPGGERYVYPDVAVVCGQAVVEQGARDVLVNPTVIVEVLSESTEQYDRGLKWEGYQRLASLTDYLLVSQRADSSGKSGRIEHFRREAEGAWSYRVAGPGERVVLSDGATLEVDALFAGMLDLPPD